MALNMTEEGNPPKEMQVRETLPRYMIPNQVYALEEMPLTANGKIDRVTLKDMAQNKKK